jgi:hypothetical protein
MYWGFELRVLHLSARHFTTWATPPVFYAFIFLQIGSRTGQAIYASWVAGVKDMCHHAQILLIEMESCKFLLGLASNLDPPTPASLARIIDMNQHTWLPLFFLMLVMTH